jgi:ribulose bisphosphate carboxylase small subunit
MIKIANAQLWVHDQDEALMAIPGAPVTDEETRDQVRDLMAKGFAGTVFLATDSGFHDPSGNSFRLTQVQLPAAV